MQSQYERIRPIVFQKAPEVKQVRSNSLAVRSSPSKPTLNQSFETQQQKDPLSELQNFRKLFVSESCHHSNKENGKRFSFKTDEIQYLKNRISQLEQQNNSYVQENKKLAHVLDQQIQLNQSLQEQHQSKNQIIKRLEENNNKSNPNEAKQISDQLSVYKKVVSDLEQKIKLVLEENEKLNDLHEKQDKNELEKYKNRCQLLENKLKQYGSYQDDNKQLDFQRKVKKLADENIQIRQAYEQLNKDYQLLQQSYSSQTGLEKNKEIINELEYENTYINQLMQIDSQKMQNLEEKLCLLTKENQRLQEIVKNRHK